MPPGRAFVFAPVLRQVKDMPGEASRARRPGEAANRNGVKNEEASIRLGAGAASLPAF